MPDPKIVECWQTTDGQLHADQFKAKDHQRILHRKFFIREIIEVGINQSDGFPSELISREHIIEFLCDNHEELIRALQGKHPKKETTNADQDQPED